jgi:toxin ParE1/3/4
VVLTHEQANLVQSLVTSAAIKMQAKSCARVCDSSSCAKLRTRPALVYRRTLIAAVTSLHHGPELPDGRARDEIQPGLRILHVARQGRRGRHFVLYRSDEAGTVDIVRIPHDTMDLARHLP